MGDKCDVQELRLCCVHGGATYLRGAYRGALYWVTSVMFRNSDSVVFMLAATDLRGADRGALYWVTSVMFRNSGSVVFMVAPRIYGERTEAHYIG